MKLLFDEGLSPKLVELLSDLFPDSESALRNGLAGAGDHRILQHAVARGFILLTTDSDFATLVTGFPAANVVILRSCNYPTTTAANHGGRIDSARRNSNCGTTPITRLPIVS